MVPFVMTGSIVLDILNSELGRNSPRVMLAPVPLFLLRPLLRRMLTAVLTAHPEIFNRLGPHKDKCFLIDPTNMPFVLLLQLGPEIPCIKAERRHQKPVHDVKIAGTLLTLLDMIDGTLDGDALFFSRDLVVQGDTEAVVCLRNALDDLEGSVADDIAGVLSSPGRVMLSALRQFRRRHDS